MAAIFLSYAREDRSFAESLARVLQGAGHDVWWDRRIRGGEEFAAEIEAELDKSDVVLVAWSKTSVKSRWVRDEAAVGGDKEILVPVSVDGTLPAMGFRQFHTLDLTNWKGGKRDDRTAELLRSVERRLKSKGKALAATTNAKPKQRLALSKVNALWLLAAVVALLGAVGSVLIFQNAGRAPPPAKPTIALLPFTMTSQDPELRALASQTRESLAHTFSQSGLPLRLLSAPPPAGSKLADFLISGDISRNGDTVIATVRLDEAAQRMTVFSHRFEATREDIQNLPERIGAQMAGNLAGSTTLKMMDRRDPLEPSLLATLLQGQNFTAGLDNLQSYHNSKRVAAKAPNFQSAQISVAFDTAFVLPQLPREERAGAVAEARRAAQRARELGPDFVDTSATACFLQSETLFAECEDALRSGKQISPDEPWLNTFLSHLLRNVGRFDESVEFARLSYNRDVYAPTKIAWMLKSLEFTGESDAARELYQQGARWWPEFKPMFFRNRLYGLVERGDFEGILKLEQEIGPKDLHPGYTSSGALVGAVRAKSISGARQACPESEEYLLSLLCMFALAALGDQDGAFTIADKLYPRRVGRTSKETEQIWLDEPEVPSTDFITSPAAAAMRRDPRYFALAERVGLIDYWRGGRLPDFCRKQPEPICAQLLKRGRP